MTAYNFSQLIDFTRTSAGTYTDSTGKITYAPNNLLTNSESFENGVWVPNSGTVTANVGVAPDGTTTADQIAAAGTQSGIYRFVTVVNGGRYTASVYAKYVSGSTNFKFGAENSPGAGVTIFNISAGTVVSNGADVIASSITAIGNGWYRCAVTFAATSTSTGFVYYASGSAGTWLQWGAQLEQVTYQTTPGTYNSTTPKNLLGYTQEFDNAAWAKSNATVTANAIAAPDGTLSADKLVEDATNNFHRTSQVPTLTATPTTASVYAKAAGRNWLYFANASSTQGAYFNLATGVVGTVLAGTTASIISVGNGWYRCSITSTPAAGAQNYSIYTANADASYVYTGDGTSGIYVWGAQLSNSASLDPYSYNPGAAPTSTAYYGPRFDYDPVTLAPKGLLIEEQRTNLLLQSQFASGWSFNANTSFNATPVTAPDGTSTARVLNDTSASTPGYAFQGVAMTTGTTYTMSVYVKKGTSNFFAITSFTQSGRAVFNLNTYAVDSVTGIVSSATITSVGGGWYRCTATMTATATASNNVGYGDFEVAPTGDLMSLWGAQLEAGAFATSYIPTVASTVTRSADAAAMLGANFSSWYNQTQGTFVVEADSTVPTTYTGVGCAVSANNSADTSLVRILQYLGRWGGNAQDLSVVQANLLQTASYSVNTPAKSAFAYRVNDFAFSASGVAPITDTSGTVPVVERVSIGSGTVAGGGSLNGHIRSISYYPTRLSNAQLQALTA